MKQFFKFLLASTLGTFLAIFLASVFFIATIIGMVSSLEEGENDESVKENTILQISWKTEIPDRADDNPFKDFDPFSFEPNQAVGLNEILKTIDRAKNDDNIVGILLDMETLPAGVATMQEIRNKLDNTLTNSQLLTQKKQSKYNKDLFISKCALCQKEVDDVHHIKHQSDFSEHYNKHHKYNLIPLCKEHHTKVHQGKIIINGFNMTERGLELSYHENKN